MPACAGKSDVGSHPSRFNRTRPTAQPSQPAITPSNAASSDNGAATANPPGGEPSEGDLNEDSVFHQFAALLNDPYTQRLLGKAVPKRFANLIAKTVSFFVRPGKVAKAQGTSYKPGYEHEDAF